MSGGKGGSQTSKVQIPKEFLDPAVRNINRAEQMASMGYQPYYGPEVAAFTPLQEQAMQSQYNAAAAFGMVPQGGNALAGIPQATEYAGGIRGYGSGDLFEQAVNEFEKRQPAQAQIYNSLFAGPNVNNTPIVPDRPVMSGGVGDGGPLTGSGGSGSETLYSPYGGNQFTDYSNPGSSFNPFSGYDIPVTAGGGLSPLTNGVSDPYPYNPFIDGRGGRSGTPVSNPEGIPVDGIPTTPSPGGEPVNSAGVNINRFNQNQLGYFNPSRGLFGMMGV